ncbi:hypothetical protein IHQ68_13290 [Chelatococcus sambhunathii]|uniref:Uncharacterized protein n=1 Tax=Chelatococcus sambhunathii TaxID=363953 RepID=A0ABU1DHJ5_9HYPH|nr:hypothetical protein [Chelatococcus sambhunathii]MDR4307593.1 hypothetical protein [Chelatococcus sambhunathii]
MVDENAHLAEANRHIALAERLIGEQRVRILEIEEVGGDLVEAERLLKNLNDTLEQLLIHRRMIIEAGGKET